jgi:hypothetical protein
MMEAERTSETSVDIQLRTRQYIPEDSELYTRRRENLKSHIYEYSPCYNCCHGNCVKGFWALGDNIKEYVYYNSCHGNAGILGLMG